MVIATSYSPHRIVPATTAEDLTAVAALFRAYADSLGVDLGYQDFAAEMAGLPGKYALPQGVLLLARGHDGTPLGCAALRPLRPIGCCEMKRLFVSPDGRGTGLGRALANSVVTEARRIGYRQIQLDTLPFMDAAIGLYQAMGFVPIPPYYATPVEGTRFLGLTLDP
jgi:GNAT superfamily N-acetyltransferase